MKLYDLLAFSAILFLILTGVMAVMMDGEDGYTHDEVKAHSRLIDRSTSDRGIEERKVALLRELYGNE